MHDHDQPLTAPSRSSSSPSGWSPPSSLYGDSGRLAANTARGRPLGLTAPHPASRAATAKNRPGVSRRVRAPLRARRASPLDWSTGRLDSTDHSVWRRPSVVRALPTTRDGTRERKQKERVLMRVSVCGGRDREWPLMSRSTQDRTGAVPSVHTRVSGVVADTMR